MAGASLLTLLDDIATLLDDVALMTKVAAKKSAAVADDVADIEVCVRKRVGPELHARVAVCRLPTALGQTSSTRPPEPETESVLLRPRDRPRPARRTRTIDWLARGCDRPP